MLSVCHKFPQISSHIIALQPVCMYGGVNKLSQGSGTCSLIVVTKDTAGHFFRPNVCKRYKSSGLEASCNHTFIAFVNSSFPAAAVSGLDTSVALLRPCSHTANLCHSQETVKVGRQIAFPLKHQHRFALATGLTREAEATRPWSERMDFVSSASTFSGSETLTADHSKMSLPALAPAGCFCNNSGKWWPES